MKLLLYLSCWHQVINSPSKTRGGKGACDFVNPCKAKPAKYTYNKRIYLRKNSFLCTVKIIKPHS